jgi:hypothetical protein
MTWRQTGPVAPDPTTLRETLAAVCRSTLYLLRFG